ncbi:MAG: hypothetical protein R3D25_06275 [Geminicoccaceae bacterium]
MAAALATIERLGEADAYPALFAKGEALAAALERAVAASGITAVVTRFGSVVALHFQRRHPRRYEDLVDGDLALDAASAGACSSTASPRRPSRSGASA